MPLPGGPRPWIVNSCFAGFAVNTANAWADQLSVAELKRIWGPGAAHELAAEVGYVPLQKHTDQLAQDRYKARGTGTMFEGKTPRVGVTMEKLLDIEQR